MKDWEKWEATWSLDKIRKIWSGWVDKATTDPVRREASRLAGKSLLDVGCGGAMQYPSYRELQPSGKYTGVDVTPKMVTVAKEFHKDVDVRVTDGAKLPFKYGDYDSVLLRHLIEHHPAHNAANIVNEALRVCKQRVIIVFFIPPVETGIPQEKKEGGFYATVYSKEWIINQWGKVCDIQYRPYPDSNEVICILTPNELEAKYWKAIRFPDQKLEAIKASKPNNAETQTLGESVSITAHPSRVLDNREDHANVFTPKIEAQCPEIPVSTEKKVNVIPEKKEEPVSCEPSLDTFADQFIAATHIELGVPEIFKAPKLEDEKAKAPEETKEYTEVTFQPMAPLQEYYVTQASDVKEDIPAPQKEDDKKISVPDYPQERPEKTIVIYNSEGGVVNITF